MAKLTKEEKKAQKEAKKAEKAERKKYEKILDSYLDEIRKGIKFLGEVSYINNLRQYRTVAKPGNMAFVCKNQRLYMWTGKRFMNITKE